MRFVGPAALQRRRRWSLAELVVQNARSGGSMNDVIIGTAPFVVALFLLLPLALFPGTALWLALVVSG